MDKKFYLGLDMGTSSVGWAATDSNYKLLRAKGKDLWGVRLFEEAHTSAERRGFRVSRRRRAREIARLGLLKEFFDEAIEAIDPGFYTRLEESKFQDAERSEENKQPYALFAGTNYTDKEYYAQYPTIFHLRKELLESTEPHDVRLVYLAIANLYKRRGHFLDASLGESEDSSSVAEMWNSFAEKVLELELDVPVEINSKQLEDILGAKGISRKKRLEEVCLLWGVDKKKKCAYAVATLLCGMSVKVIDLFGEEVVGEEHKKVSISFRESGYEEKALEVQSILGDELWEIMSILKEIHDKGMLSGLMNGYNYLSQARVAVYDVHKADLVLLKKVLKKYDSNAYKEMFRIMQDYNYSAYVGSVNSDKQMRRGAKKNREEFLKYVKKVVSNTEKFPVEDSDVQEILQRIDDDAFMPKQLSASNGVIPNQLHYAEMAKILRNAENYLPFLKEKDETGLTVSEKILQVYKFQIPYYVGPLPYCMPGTKEYKTLCKEHNVWAERKELGAVYPWNFEEKIDTKKSAENFIVRMVRHCSYLTGEYALPKNSMLYEKFMVLDELNNLKVYGEKVSIEQKQNIYYELFGHGKKVSIKALYGYLVRNGIVKKEDVESSVSGIDGGFKSSLTTVGKFYGIFGEEVFSDKNTKVIEDIVFWGTVYGNDKKMLREKISEKYPQKFSDQELKRICGFKFEGWGRLSRSFLEMEGCSEEDGVCRTFIGAMWETNDNHMELLSNHYTYRQSLDEKLQMVEKPLKEWQIEELDDMYLSAPVKRMVWQTISILKELEETLGKKPDRIFVEMAREEGEKNKRTISRKQKLIDLYKSIGKEGKEWCKEIEGMEEASFKNRKLYLYYLQMGRCIYTGAQIDLHTLLTSNDQYDIDHIYPQHFVKDDSLENNLVLSLKDFNNNVKKDIVPLPLETRKKQRTFWEILRSKGFISEEKFNRLIRSTAFTEEELAGFINRQLVETRQGTKVITQILKQAYPNAEIVFTKAGVVSDFRKKYELLKVRCVNNYHHAHDAYLNIVVGNTYFVKFTKDPYHFIKDAIKDPNRSEYKYHMGQIFDWTVCRNGETAWVAACDGKESTIKTVKQILDKNSPLVTKYAAEYHGGITRKVTVYGKDIAKEGSYIPVKMNDERLKDVTKYGGLTNVSVSGYALIEYSVKGKKVRSLESIPVYLGRSTDLKETKMEKYFADLLQRENGKNKVSDVRICYKFIPSNSLIRYNGFYYYLGGKTDSNIMVRSALEFNIHRDVASYIKKIEKAVKNDYYEEVNAKGEKILSMDRNVEIYDLLLARHKNSIYSKRLGTMANIVESGRDKFLSLKMNQQCYVLMELINNIVIGEKTDVSLIGGSSQSGVMRINKKISNAEEVTLIHQSVTGLYSAEVNLLTV